MGSILNKKHLIILISILIILPILPIISAVPPVTRVQQFSTGFVLKSPIDNVIRQNQDIEFHFHVYNITDGVAMTSGISCIFHLYNKTGNEQLKMIDTTSSTLDYSFDVSGTNFTELGESYYYNIYCNSSKLGGYDDVELLVTYSGEHIDPAQATLYLGLLGIFVLLFIFSIYILNKLPRENETDEWDKILSVNYLKYLRLPIWITSYFLFIGILFLASNLAYAFLIEGMFPKILFTLYRIAFMLSPIVMIVIVLSFFTKFFYDKSIQKMLERGITPDKI